MKRSPPEELAKLMTLLVDELTQPTSGQEPNQKKIRVLMSSLGMEFTPDPISQMLICLKELEKYPHLKKRTPEMANL